jgi:hypothetical protein
MEILRTYFEPVNKHIFVIPLKQVGKLVGNLKWKYSEHILNKRVSTVLLNFIILTEQFKILKTYL